MIFQTYNFALIRVYLYIYITRYSMKTLSVLSNQTESSGSHYSKVSHICSGVHINTYSIWLYSLLWFMDRWTITLNLLLSKFEDLIPLAKLDLSKHPPNTRNGGNRLKWNKSSNNQTRWLSVYIAHRHMFVGFFVHCIHGFCHLDGTQRRTTDVCAVPCIIHQRCDNGDPVR